jgi:pimeloyl-ACP methyl ester carboxylesterase
MNISEKNNDRILVKGHQLYYKFINSRFNKPEKPLLVFLHEGLGSVAQWGNFPLMLSDEVKCPVMMYDRYGYGKSEMLKEKRGTDYLEVEALEFLPGVIDALNIENKLVLIGHSDGGSIALIYASKYGKQVAGVITEAPHVFVEEVTIKGINEAVSFYEIGILNKLLLRFHQENTETMFYGWADTWRNLENVEWNTEHYLAGISSPLLVIQGENDEYGSVKQVDSIVNQSSGYSEKFMIPHCAHIPHYEAQEIVLEKMAKFITNHALK